LGDGRGRKTTGNRFRKGAPGPASSVKTKKNSSKSPPDPQLCKEGNEEASKKRKKKPEILQEKKTEADWKVAKGLKKKNKILEVKYPRIRMHDSEPRGPGRGTALQKGDFHRDWGAPKIHRLVEGTRVLTSTWERTVEGGEMKDDGVEMISEEGTYQDS